MSAQKSVFLLITIMVITTLGTEILVIGMLYNTALQEERARLIETASSQARLIEAVARFDARRNEAYPMGARAATLSQIIDAHKRYKGFGKTGEFTIAEKKENSIDFILTHRGNTEYMLKPIPWEGNLAEPMRKALSGRSGSTIALDYKGDLVLAAYEPVGVLNLGIVAKINIEEVRAPFIRAGLFCTILGVVAVLIGAWLFMRITNPMVQRLVKTVDELNAAMLKVKQLSGLLPICSQCKRIRDEKDSWKRMEEYISDHSEADFTHGICPECSKKLYPELFEQSDKDGE